MANNNKKFDRRAYMKRVWAEARKINPTHPSRALKESYSFFRKKTLIQKTTVPVYQLRGHVMGIYPAARKRDHKARAVFVFPGEKLVAKNKDEFRSKWYDGPIFKLISEYWKKVDIIKNTGREKESDYVYDIPTTIEEDKKRKIVYHTFDLRDIIDWVNEKMELSPEKMKQQETKIKKEIIITAKKEGKDETLTTREKLDEIRKQKESLREDIRLYKEIDDVEELESVKKDFKKLREREKELQRKLEI